MDDIESSIVPSTGTNSELPLQGAGQADPQLFIRQEAWHEEKSSSVTETMPRQQDLEASMTDLLDDICESSDAAINILDDLLNYEHIDAGQDRAKVKIVKYWSLFTDEYFHE